MIKSVLTNQILNLILSIDQRKQNISQIRLPISYANKLRKNSRKMSSYASNKIEGNPLTYDQASRAIDDPHKHLLKPEQEIRNYWEALEFLEQQRNLGRPVSESLILEVQKIVVKGESTEKTGYRGEMPPGMLFAVYDSNSGEAEYIPPEYSELKDLILELVNYLEKSDDHPLIKAAIIHYQLVTIHPFEDGNGRTARLISDYYLDLTGYGFANLGSLEEYFNYDLTEYYSSIQMNLPALYYSGRNNPPHPEIWITYFLRMVDLYSEKVMKLASEGDTSWVKNGLQPLNKKEKTFLLFLIQHGKRNFTPKEISLELNVTNRTIINWCASLVESGFLTPEIVKERIRSYSLSDLCLANSKSILGEIK